MMCLMTISDTGDDRYRHEKTLDDQSAELSECTRSACALGVNVRADVLSVEVVVRPKMG